MKCWGKTCLLSGTPFQILERGKKGFIRSSQTWLSPNLVVSNLVVCIFCCVEALFCSLLRPFALFCALLRTCVCALLRSQTLFFRHFGASKMALTKARLLKHDLPFHGKFFRKLFVQQKGGANYYHLTRQDYEISSP